MNGKRKMREMPAHEMVAYAAILLACGESNSGATVNPATEHQDKRESTDFWLRHGRLSLRLDVTKGRVGWKIAQNQKHRLRRGDSFWVWGIHVEFATVISIIGCRCWSQLWQRIMSGEVRSSLKREDVCPDHGADCRLVEQLEWLGRRFVSQLPEGDPDHPNRRRRKNWKALFK